MNHYREEYKKVLLNYVPNDAVEKVLDLIQEHSILFKIKSSRLTKLGDYRPPVNGNEHQITINNNLNKYSFLITFVHEVAHLINWNKHKHLVLPHGKEWKLEYARLMHQFYNERIFPQDILSALKKHFSDVKASSCSDSHLLKILRRYDLFQSLHVEELPVNTIFTLTNGQSFIKGMRLRKRYKCKEVGTNKNYLVSPMAEVLSFEAGNTAQ
jgi:hypothetical protein